MLDARMEVKPNHILSSTKRQIHVVKNHEFNQIEWGLQLDKWYTHKDIKSDT